jgi:hypothetical protein
MQEYKIVFTFEDASGNVIVKEEPFTINISSMGMDNGMNGGKDGVIIEEPIPGGDIGTFDPTMPDGKPQGGGILGMPVWLFFTVLGGILVIAAIVVIVIIKKRKAKKDELMEDEDN